MPFTANLTSNPSQDWTSPCNPNSDTDDLNLNGVINSQFEVDRAPGIQPADNFIDGYEYWSRSTRTMLTGVRPNEPTILFCSGIQMHPKLGVDADNSDYDAEILSVSSSTKAKITRRRCPT